MSHVDLDGPVVVGIDGSTDSLHALDWATAQAAEHGWPVLLVNAYEPLVVAKPAMGLRLPDAAEHSDAVLSHARSWVMNAHPELTVSTKSEEGPAPRVLLESAKDGRMLVVGREGLGRFAELVLGSVSLACASRATTPVAVIPAAWEPPAEPFGRVVVGVDGSPNCQAALRYAFDTAQDNDAELVAVFAWHQPTRWPEGWPLTGEHKLRFQVDYDLILSEALAGWHEKYLNVVVKPAGENAHPAEALARHAHRADLVVIGGRVHGAVTGMLLGSVAHAILRHVHRPIMVVHQPEE